MWLWLLRGKYKPQEKKNPPSIARNQEDAELYLHWQLWISLLLSLAGLDGEEIKQINLFWKTQS